MAAGGSCSVRPTSPASGWMKLSQQESPVPLFLLLRAQAIFRERPSSSLARSTPGKGKCIGCWGAQNLF
jgi:hypothetical protein